LVQSKPHNPLPRVRKLALSFPEAHEVEAWGEPRFRVKNKVFAMYAHANTHHGSGRNAVWCKAKPVNQGQFVMLLTTSDGGYCGLRTNRHRGSAIKWGLRREAYRAHPQSSLNRRS